MKKTSLRIIAILSLLVITLVGCQQSGTKQEAGKEEDKVIVVGASPNPHAKILEEVVKPLLEKEGYTLEVKVFNDYVLPNKALSDGSLDANFFQHQPYLDEYNEKNQTDLLGTVAVHLEPMGVYSEKVTSLNDLAENAIVAVPNDPTNESRALQILVAEGLIKVNDSALLTKNDITENPKNLEIKEITAEQLPASLPDVDIALINSNYALQANLNPVSDALAIESTDSPYANLIAIRPEDKDSEKIKALEKALQSPEVKEYIETEYKGAIIPAFN